MATILMNARLRQSYITQLGKQYSKMKPTEDEMRFQAGGQLGDEEMVVISKSMTGRLNENKRSAIPDQGDANKINSQQSKKIKVAWRFHLRRLRVKVNGLRKRLGGSVMKGVQGSRALVFHGATSTAANLVKSTSFFCHFNQRFHLLFLSANCRHLLHNRLT